MADLENITDVAGIKKLFNELQKRERELDDELDGVIADHSYLDNKVKQIRKLLPNLKILLQDSDRLNEVICSTSLIAEGISGKVRLLDLAKSRVQDTIKRVDDILDLKSCVEGVQDALSNEEYEQAAAFIHRYLSLDERALREILPDNVEGTDLNTAFTFLHNAQAQLSNTVQQKFGEAVASCDAQATERFFKLFPLVGASEHGLYEFSKYLRTQLMTSATLHAENALKINPEDRRANVVFADTLTLLFEHVAKLIEDKQPLVDTYYGPGRMNVVLAQLQEECDIQSTKIIGHFEQSRKFNEMLDDVKKSQKMHKATSAVNEKLDPRHVDVLLGEVVLLIARTELYSRFLKKRVKGDLDSLPEDERLRLAELEDKLVSNSGLSRKIQGLAGEYIMMEEYFMKEMVSKAVSMDYVDSDSLISSMVDDVFYVIQKCLRRSLSTSNLDVLCAMVNDASSLFLSEYKDVLRGRLKAGFPSGSLDFSNVFQGKLQIQSGSTGHDLEQSRRNFLVALNNLEASSENMKKLWNDLQDECFKLYSQIGDSGKGKVEMMQADIESLRMKFTVTDYLSCLSDMSSCAQSFKDLLQTGISQLCATGIIPRLNTLIENFANVNHVITEEDFSFFEVNDPFVQNFLVNLEKLLGSLKSTLTAANYDNLVSLVCSEIAINLEKMVMKCSFNRLGGLQFDKDLRCLIGYFTNTTEWTVRDKFARLTQLATVLNLEKVSELLDYWGANSGPLTWRLTPSEIRQVLALRVDFRMEDIQRLKL